MSEEEDPQPGPSKPISLLDFPGLGLTSDDDDAETPINRVQASSSSGVSAVPSRAGLGFTFLMDEDEASDDDDEEDDDDGGDNPARFIGEASVSGGAGQEEAEESDMASKRRQGELTEQYLAGQLSFKDLINEINTFGGGEDDGDTSEVHGDERDSDSEWRPRQRKKKTPVAKKKKAEDGSSDEEEDPEQEDHQSKFEAELDATQRQQLGKKRARVGVKQRRKRLDPALQGLMGEANLNFARGERELAIKMCMEVIRQEPNAPEPYQTLSTLYEENGEQEKSLQFALLAAHLAPNDAEEWARLADMSTEIGDLSLSAYCYRKAIDADMENVRYHWSRCAILEQAGEKRGALRGFRRLQQVLKGDMGDEYLRAGREIARLLHERGEIEDAKNALSEAASKYPASVGSEDVNLLLELLLALGGFHEALEVLCQHGKLQFASERSPEELASMDPEQQLGEFSSVLLPEGEEAAPLDIVSKMIVVLVNLKADHLVTPYTDRLLEADPDDCGDLFLDVAESFMTNSGHRNALPFLEKLVASESYGQAEVWLRYGECHFELGNLEEAESAYSNVVEMAPQHHDARRTLSNILHRLGKAEEALETLHQDAEAELLNPTLLYERCNLLLAEGCNDEFVEKAKMLFSRHFVDIRSREELHAVVSAKKLSSKNRALIEARAFVGKERSGGDEEGPEFEKESEISLADEFALFRKLCDLLYELKRFPELQRLTFSALGSPYFNKNPDIVKECEFLCLLSSFLNGDCYHAYNLVRELVIKDVENNRLWNLFNLVIMRADDVRHNRFLMRLMQRNQDNVALGILNGHNCLVAGTYKYSLGEYMSVFRQDSSNPMVALMLGLTFTHMACQKFSAKKHSLVVQACAFLNTYLHLRGRCQEAYYNLGRAMHQLGLLNAALFYYKKALAKPPAVAGDPKYDLSREAAFNASLIYRGSGANDLANELLEKYIVV